MNWILFWAIIATVALIAVLVYLFFFVKKKDPNESKLIKIARQINKEDELAGIVLKTAKNEYKAALLMGETLKEKEGILPDLIKAEQLTNQYLNENLEAIKTQKEIDYVRKPLFWRMAEFCAWPAFIIIVIIGVGILFKNFEKSPEPRVSVSAQTREERTAPAASNRRTSRDMSELEEFSTAVTDTSNQQH